MSREMWAPKSWRESPNIVPFTGGEPLWSDDVRVLVQEIPEGMTSDATALDARLAQVEAEMARSDPRYVSETVREIVTLGRAVLALLDEQWPVDEDEPTWCGSCACQHCYERQEAVDE